MSTGRQHCTEFVDSPLTGFENLVDNRVDPAFGQFVSFVLPEGAARDRETEITSRLFVPRVGRFGRFFAHSRVGSARRDVIGIPVSVLPSWRAKQRCSNAARLRVRGVGVCAGRIRLPRGR